MSSALTPTAANVEPDNTSLLESQDESVRIAIRALGDMRAGGGPSHVSAINTSVQPTPALSTASALSSPSISTPSMDGIPHPPSPDYLARMSGLPLVSGALRAYEHGKNSSRVVKYGAEMMESSISTISRPVIDRLGIGGRPSPHSPPAAYLDRGRPDPSETNLSSRDPSLSNTDDDRRARADAWVEERRTSHDRSRTPQPPTTVDDASGPAQPPQEVARRSRWQTMLLEAGGISAAISDDNMRRLKFCLQWLQYATSHIDAQILILRDFIASLNPNAPVSVSHLRTFNDIKRDVVGTVREAVAVVSKYAGGALPEPARNTVRTFILHLPQRWARAAAPVLAQPVAHSHHLHHLRPAPEHAVGGNSGLSAASSSRRAAHANTPYSRPASPTAGTSPTSPRHARTATAASLSSVANAGTGTASTTVAIPAAATTAAAQRILTLATESLDMMRGVTGVVKDSLDRADMWLDRLRMVGIQRQQPDAADELVLAGPSPARTSSSVPAFASSSSPSSYPYSSPPPPPSVSSSSAHLSSYASPTPRRGSVDVMARAPSLACSSAPSYTESPMSSRPPTPGSSVGGGAQLPDFRTLTLSSRYTSPLVETAALPPIVKVKEESGMEVDA